MRTNAVRCVTALAFAGLVLTGCGSAQSEFSTPFASTTSTNLDDAQIQLRGTTEGTTANFLPRVKPVHGLAVLEGIRPKILDPVSPLQCVPFAREASGISIYGDAKNWWRLAEGRYAKATRPEVGAVIVMKGYRTTRRGHVAVVKQIVDERTIVVDHANWGNDGRIHLNAPMRDESPKNDWSKVRVWYTPGNAWGKRIYRTRGFILPTTAVATLDHDSSRN